MKQLRPELSGAFFRGCFASSLAVLFFWCSTVFAAEAPSELAPALDSFTAEGLLQHTRILASDDFEGRGLGTVGEEKTVSYLADQFRRLGLKPGNPDGTFFQEVPMVGATAESSASYAIANNRTTWVVPEECVAWTRRVVPEIKLESTDVVFVGYGVVAPEYGWDDYKGADVRGKTILMLINDPQIPDPKDPKKLDPAMFKGKAMTYYGRWTYKYEIAAEKGAAAAVIIHETDMAGYPWEVVQNSNTGENFDLETSNGNMDRVEVQSWVQFKQARALAAECGLDLAALKKAALSKDFKPVSLKAKMSFTIKNSHRKVRSRNVVARLEGSDPRMKEEHVIYTSHWDHLGRDPKLQGDQIYNGALDNASGTAMLLELAKAYGKLKTPPRRSILFIATTGEEEGLLGAKYYANNPLWPVERTVADLNIDTINVLGRTRSVEIVGQGNSSLEDLAAEVALTQNRHVVPESMPELGGFYRADHLEFCKAGVPALYLWAGLEYIGRPADWGLQKTKEFFLQHYHKVSDEVRSDWDLSGALEDEALLFQVGWSVAQTEKRPEWKAGSEFKSRRKPALP